MKLALGFMANGAPGHYLVYIFSHFGPMKVLLQNVQGLVHPKVSSK